MKRILLLLLLLVLLIACPGCALRDYDRTYSLSYSDGKQTVSAGLTLRPRTP